MSKLLLLITFFAITPVVFIFSLLFYLSISYHAKDHSRISLLSRPQTVAYAALPTSENIFDGEIVSEDGRVESIRQFFARYNSPLEEHAPLIVALADEYDLDYRLIPAIAMQESTLCKKIPLGSYNCWGYGIYGGKVTRFADYPEAIETVTKGLAKRYIAQGLKTPQEIMKKYTPSSNGSWAQGVNSAMKQME